MGNSSRGGFTLIEVLVALCLLSIAALGVADMQWQAMRTTQLAMQDGSALRLAADMAERLRGLPRFDALVLDTDSLSPEASAPSCDGRACGPEQWLAAQAQEWGGLLQASLPGGRARICADPSPWDAESGGYRWDCGDGTGPLMVKIGWRSADADAAAVRIVLVLGEAPR
jgi:type IV pilus assembly protein PilV